MDGHSTRGRMGSGIFMKCTNVYAYEDMENMLNEHKVSFNVN